MTSTKILLKQITNVTITTQTITIIIPKITQKFNVFSPDQNPQTLKPLNSMLTAVWLAQLAECQFLLKPASIFQFPMLACEGQYCSQIEQGICSLDSDMFLCFFHQNRLDISSEDGT